MWYVPKRAQAVEAEDIPQMQHFLLLAKVEMRWIGKVGQNMSGGRELKAKVGHFLWSVRGTLALFSVILLVYATQLVAAGSVGTDVAYRVIEEHIRPHAGYYFVLSPLVHSSHDHIVWNLGFLLIGGTITERRVGWRKFIPFVYGVGVLSNFLPPYLGLGGFGVGVSGANYGLWVFFGLFYMTEWYRAGADDVPLDRQTLGYGLLALIGLTYASIGVLQYVGQLPAPSGAAKGGHLLGIAFGVAWFAVHSLGSDVTVPYIRPGA